VAVAAADRRKLALDGDVMVVGQGSARGCASGRGRGLSAPSFPSSCFSICDVATVGEAWREPVFLLPVGCGAGCDE
jgi:hypothetical protein